VCASEQSKRATVSENDLRSLAVFESVLFFLPLAARKQANLHLACSKRVKDKSDAATDSTQKHQPTRSTTNHHVNFLTAQVEK